MTGATATLWALMGATFRVSTPLVFAALGGILSERSGVINIALEGMMLVGAFSAAVATLASHSPWTGLAAGALSGAALAAVYGMAVIELRSDQIVGGTAINLLAMGIPPFVLKILYDNTGSTPGIPLGERFSWEPMAAAAVCVAVFHFWLTRTPSGLWVAFAGEHPLALEAAGIRVRKVRWAAVLGSGFLAGMGGATLSICLASAYTRNMTSGRGFMALAALIFGKWKPFPAAAACLFFGLTDAAQTLLQGVELGGRTVPTQLIQILPYVVTVLALAGFVGRSRPPKALGIPLAAR